MGGGARTVHPARRALSSPTSGDTAVNEPCHGDGGAQLRFCGMLA